LAINDILSFNANLGTGRKRRHATSRRAGGRLVGALALVLLGAGCNPTAPTNNSPLAASGCDLNRERCTADTRWGALRLELSPRPLPVLDPIALEVRFDRTNKTHIRAQLDGVDMDMGPNVATLQRVDGQSLRGQLIIPICLTGTMKWRLRLMIRDDAQEQTVDFSFAAPLEPGNPAADHRR
jgi:hypothetical protein